MKIIEVNSYTSMGEMDVLWAKEKLQKILSKDTLPVMGDAFGDGNSTHRCSVCGGDESLRYINETYTQEGVEERYDDIIIGCFGVRVNHKEGMICEGCIDQLRNTQKFRAQLIAAFSQAPCEMSTNHSKLGKGEGIARKIKPIKVSKVEEIKKNTQTVKDSKYNARRERKLVSYNSSQPKRTNLACTICNQRYPMIVPFDGWKKFVCSRCKKKYVSRNSADIKRMYKVNPSNLKKELKGKTRLLSNKMPHILHKGLLDDSLIPLATQPRSFACTSLPKRNQEMEIDCTCGICGKELKSRSLLDKHMRAHTGQPVYQCDVCMKNFTGKNNFQTHYLTHGNV